MTTNPERNPIMHVDHILHIEDLPKECIEECSAPGPADAAVDYWREELNFTVNRERAIDCLVGYGAWEREALEEDEDHEIAERILWLACGDFREYLNDPSPDASCGSDIFVLE